MIHDSLYEIMYTNIIYELLICRLEDIAVKRNVKYVLLIADNISKSEKFYISYIHI